MARSRMTDEQRRAAARESSQRWRDKNREAYRATKKRWRDRVRLLRPETYKAYITKRNRRQVDRMRIQKFGTDGANLYVEQNGVCKICLRDMLRYGGNSMLAAQLDHDHNTGKVRGWLCRACNLSVGLLGDDVERMARAIEYVRNNGCLLVKNVQDCA